MFDHNPLTFGRKCIAAIKDAHVQKQGNSFYQGYKYLNISYLSSLISPPLPGEDVTRHRGFGANPQPLGQHRVGGALE